MMARVPRFKQSRASQRLRPKPALPIVRRRLWGGVRGVWTHLDLRLRYFATTTAAVQYCSSLYPLWASSLVDLYYLIDAGRKTYQEAREHAPWDRYTKHASL